MARAGSGRGRGLELRGLVVGDQAGHDLLEVTVEDLLQAVDGEADPVVGDPRLLEVVGADLLGAVAAAHLALAVARDRLLLLRERHLVEPRAQHLHGLLAVLDLALLVLAGDDRVRGEVRDPHRRVGGVDALAAGAGRAEGVDPDVLGVDLDVDLLGLRQDRHGDGRGVDPARGLGRGNALHPVDAALEAQLRVDAVALDHGDDFLDAALAGAADGHDVHLPALPLGVALVHPEHVAGEERGLVAAGAGPDLEQDVLVVVRVLRDQEEGDLGVERVALRLEGPGLLVGHLPQLGVRVDPRHLLDLGELLEGVLVGAIALDDGRGLLRLACQLLVGGRVLRDRRVRHPGLDLGEACLDLPELLEGDPVHVRAGAPAASGLGGGGLPGARVLAVEALDAAGDVQQPLLAGEEGVAGGADLQAHLLLRGPGGPGGAAGAVDVDDGVIGMNSSLHDTPWPAVTYGHKPLFYRNRGHPGGVRGRKPAGAAGQPWGSTGLHPSLLQREFAIAVRAAGLTKPATPSGPFRSYSATATSRPR